MYALNIRTLELKYIHGMNAGSRTTLAVAKSNTIGTALVPSTTRNGTAFVDTPIKIQYNSKNVESKEQY